MSVGAPLHTYHDASGKITVTVFQVRGDPQAEIWKDQEVTVGDPDMVAIGGGGAASDGHINTTTPGTGSFLTASYPNENWTGWKVSARDHQIPQAYALYSYVIGMKIAGLSRQALVNNLLLVTDSTGASPHPEKLVGLGSNSYVLAGGGFQVEDGIPNLGTASFPSGENTWTARSQDHMTPAAASLTVWAIGIRNNLPGVGQVLSAINNSNDGPTNHPSCKANVEPGYALTGGGAQVDSSVNGNMLWQLQPSTDSLPWFMASSMDHIVAAPATIISYAVGLRIR
jgi:hypothetical protein